MTMTACMYLDYNATAPARAAAIAAAADAAQTGGNPSSVHAAGRRARAIIDSARDAVARAVHCAAEEVVFTSGATEANNLVISGLNYSAVVTSPTEHDSLLAAAQASGRPVHVLPVDKDGKVNLSGLADLLRGIDGPALVSLMMANNETGVIQPVSEAARTAKEFGGLIHTDAVQAPGRIPVDFQELDADLMSLSGHKIGGLAGTGALIVRSGLSLTPAIRGGGQERNRRAGTENLSGIAAFGAALREAVNDLDSAADMADRRDRMEAGIKERVPGVRIYGEGAGRLPNTSCIGLPGVRGETQVMALDLAGFAVSSGSACSSGKVGPSHVLAAMGVGNGAAREAIRVSIGPDTSDSDLDQFISAYIDMAGRLRDSRTDTTEAAE